MAEDLLNVILRDTFIKNQAERRVVALKNYLLSGMFKTGKTEAAPKTATDNPEIQVWLSKLDKKVLEAITAQNVYAVLDKTEADLKAIEPLVLYLPYELPPDEVAAIGARLRSDYGPKFLMEITIDPNLIAGCAISYKGIYKDYSVKQRIVDNKQAILETFRRYVKH